MVRWISGDDGLNRNRPLVSALRPRFGHSSLLKQDFCQSVVGRAPYTQREARLRERQIVRPCGPWLDTGQRRWTMNLTWTPQERQFREDVRAFAAAKLPDDIRGKVLRHQRLERDDYVRWHNILADQGWGAPNWPVEADRLETRLDKGGIASIFNSMSERSEFRRPQLHPGSSTARF